MVAPWDYFYILMNRLESIIRGLTTRHAKLLVLALTALVMFPVLGGEFLDWDDGTYIFNNPLIIDSTFSNFLALFTTLQVGGAYMPLTLATYFLEYALVGLDPSLYHLDSYLFHLVNTLLLFHMLQLWTKDMTLSLVCALIFGIHPIHIESVAWISGRKDLLMTFFTLLSLIQFHRYKTVNNFRNYIWTFVFLILAFLSKGISVVLPVIFLSLDKYLYKENLKKSVARLWPMFLVAVVIGIIAWWAQISGAQRAIPEIGESWMYGPVVGLRNIFQYLFLFILPVNLSGFHPYPFDPGAAPDLSFIFKALAGLCLVWIIWRTSSRWYQKVGLIWMLAFLFPTLQFIPLGEAIIAERFAYLASVGMLLVFYGYSKMLFKSWPQSYSLLALLAISIGSVFISWRYIPTWNNTISFWQNVSEVYPDHDFAYAALGSAHLKLGNYDRAYEALNRSIIYNPENLGALNNRGLLHWDRKMYDEAIQDFREILKVDPTDPKAHMNLALVYLNDGQVKNALESFEQSIRLNPKNPLVYYNRGLLYNRTGLYDKAIQDFQVAVNLGMQRSLMVDDVVEAFLALGRIDEAIYELEVDRESNLDPSRVQLLDSLKATLQ